MSLPHSSLRQIVSIAFDVAPFSASRASRSLRLLMARIPSRAPAGIDLPEIKARTVPTEEQQRLHVTYKNKKDITLQGKAVDIGINELIRKVSHALQCSSIPCHLLYSILMLDTDRTPRKGAQAQGRRPLNPPYPGAQKTLCRHYTVLYPLITPCTAYERANQTPAAALPFQLYSSIHTERSPSYSPSSLIAPRSAGTPCLPWNRFDPICCGR